MIGTLLTALFAIGMTTKLAASWSEHSALVRGTAIVLILASAYYTAADVVALVSQAA